MKGKGREEDSVKGEEKSLEEDEEETLVDYR